MSAEVRERAVRMVLDYQGEHGSQYAAIRSIAASPDYSRDALDYGPSGWIRAAFALRAGGAPILTTIRRNAWCSAGLEHHRAGLMNNPG